MSIIFGLLRNSSPIVLESQLQRAATMTERYATGAGHMFVKGPLGMGLQPYLSHQRSEFEIRPVGDALGRAVSFDGRLDNYLDLIDQLDLPDTEKTDSQIVLAAFDRWGSECFSHFVGDWALALWSETNQTLYLARDHAGARTLYFSQESGSISWSTYLDSFGALNSATSLSNEYVACYLMASPVRDLTPYKGIKSVPPAHYISFRKGTVSRHAHWSSTVHNAICYKADKDYETQFLGLLRQSVDRRTGPGKPILAQLSGGMDSTSIVCMSDHIRRSVDADAEIFDTLSFFDDSEASLNEKPHFSVTEAQRGKVGIHLDVAFAQRTFEAHDSANGRYLLPGSDSFSFEQERRLDAFLQLRGYRSVLSGIGGDEVLGGVPIAFPELADHLVSGNISRLLRQSVAWSLVDRSPVISMLYRTTRYTMDLYSRSKSHRAALPPWISSDLGRTCQEIRSEESIIGSRIGVAPHRLDNSLSWWSIMETLPHLSPRILSRLEYRYPLLDKDLVQFLFSIPREQILRPGRRRSLMRRALVGIVPHEILERRRKAFQLRAPLSALVREKSRLEELFGDSILAKMGFIDPRELRRVLEQTTKGDPVWRRALMSTIALELWLRTDGIGDERKMLATRGELYVSLTA